mgnify:FL=1
MKKFFVTLLGAVLVFSLWCFSVSAAGSAKLSGPGTVRAGDTITVSFSAGGGIYGGSGSLQYDSKVLTLQSFSSAMASPWVVERSGNNFVFYDNSMSKPLDSGTVWTATFLVSDKAATGASISVSATGVVVSDGNADTNVGTCTYSATIAPPLSGNANLSALKVSNATLSPAFSPSTTSYNASVPYSVSSLQISATPEDKNATVSISNNSLAPNGTTDVTVTVTAENGVTKSYVIHTFREKDPNYVESSVNTLDSLSVDGFLLSPVFSPEQLEYAVYLPYETQTIVISGTKTHGLSSVTFPEVGELPVGESTHEITVTAENGDTRTYTITVFRAEPFPPQETEPPTEATTEATTKPTTEATTEATTQEEVTQEAQGSNWFGSIWMAAAAACVGILLGIGGTVLFFRKKKSA